MSRLKTVQTRFKIELNRFWSALPMPEYGPIKNKTHTMSQQLGSAIESSWDGQWIVVFVDFIDKQ